MINQYDHVYARVQYHGSADVIDLLIHNNGPKTLDEIENALESRCSILNVILRYRSRTYNQDQVTLVEL